MKRYIIIVVLLLVGYTTAEAQYSIDAVRLSQNGGLAGARAAAMGGAFTGVADDFSALYWNPAGLGQLRTPEFTAGLQYFKMKNDASFLGSSMSSDNSSTSLNSIGFALPFPVARGSFVLAVGYNRTTDFTGALSFSGFNTASSIIPSLYDASVDYDVAWQTGVEDTTGYSPITKNVKQDGEVLESGSLNQWSFGGSMEVAPNLSVGLGLNVMTGSYKWERTFTETDPLGVHGGVIAGRAYDRSGFSRFVLDEAIDQDVSGWNMKIGVLYAIPDKARFGLTIQTPTWYTVKEDFTRGAAAYFTGLYERYSFKSYNDYDITTPWMFSFGASYNPVKFVTVSGDVDLADHSETEFSNSSAEDFNSSEKNKVLKKNLRSTTDYRFGLEVVVPHTDLAVRGGYSYRFTPFKDLSSDFDRKTISFGLGYTFEHSFTINATWLMTSYTQENLNYDDPDLSVPNSYLTTSEKIKSSALLFSIAYRF